jgi:hypothetical protein
MHPDTDNDTRSPWYEAFAPTPQAQLDASRSAAGAAAETTARPETSEPDGSTEALFDCYNG